MTRLELKLKIISFDTYFLSNIVKFTSNSSIICSFQLYTKTCDQSMKTSYISYLLLQPSGPSNGPHGPLPPSLQGPRQPFPGSTQYGPPPGGPIIPPVTGSHTPSPSCGASPTPSSGSGGGSSGQFISGGHPPGYPAYHPGSEGRRPYKQKPRSRNQPPLPSSLAAPLSTTPPTSPRKRGDRGGNYPNYLFKKPYTKIGIISRK